MWRAGIDLEAVALGAIGIRALNLRVMDARLDDRALGVVDDESCRNGGEPFEGATMTAEPGRHRLVPDKLDVLVPREAKRHDEGPGAAWSTGRVLQERAGTEIDLGRFAGGEAQPIFNIP